MASAGKEYLVYLTGSGTAGGTQYAVDYQGDLALNTGKGLQTTPFKQDQMWSSQTTDGVSFSMDVLAQEPLGTAVSLMMDANDNGTDVYVFVQTTKVGGQRFSGKMKVALTKLSAPVSGPAMLSFSLAQSGTNTRATV